MRPTKHVNLFYIQSILTTPNVEPNISQIYHKSILQKKLVVHLKAPHCMSLCKEISNVKLERKFCLHSYLVENLSFFFPLYPPPLLKNSVGRGYLRFWWFQSLNGYDGDKVLRCWEFPIAKPLLLNIFGGSLEQKKLLGTYLLLILTIIWMKL